MVPIVGAISCYNCQLPTAVSFAVEYFPHGRTLASHAHPLFQPLHLNSTFDMSIRAEFVAVLVATIGLGHVMEASAGVTTVYSNDFRDHYPKVGQRFDLRPYELEPPAVIWDSAHDRKITILRTRGDKYGYEQQKCVVTVEGGSLTCPRFLSVLGFRNVEASWITGKLIAIKLDIGHVAGVDAIYDVEGNKLLYCESVTYITEPDVKHYQEKQVRRAIDQVQE
jgi:hypothetical protein